MPTVDKPAWVSHGGSAIYALDIHHSGERMATCGIDYKIRIWAMRPILSHSAENDPNQPKLLAALADHAGCVNVVRFAPVSNLLASGSDDKALCIYELKPGQGRPAFGSSDTNINYENWRPRTLLNGHQSNVVDLAWSPDATMLASASLDGHVIVWDAATGRSITTLAGHQGFVKGVAWDPFNHYLASQGEDGVLIWSVRDWNCVAHVKEALDCVTSVNFHMRLAWSPDGQTLTATNCLNGPANVAPLIQRNTWGSNNQFVGHKAPITAVRYNPRYFYPRHGKSDEVCCIATLCANDKKWSVWSPVEQAPIMVGKGFFSNMVTDAAWSPNGHALLLASSDGTVTCVQFAKGELGRELPDEDVQQYINLLYGDPRARNGRSLAAAPELLQLAALANGSASQDGLAHAGSSRGASGAAASAVGAAPDKSLKLGERLGASNEAGPGNGQAARSGVTGVGPGPSSIASRPAAGGPSSSSSGQHVSIGTDGRKRLQPQALGAAANGPMIGGGLGTSMGPPSMRPPGTLAGRGPGAMGGGVGSRPISSPGRGMRAPGGMAAGGGDMGPGMPAKRLNMGAGSMASGSSGVGAMGRLAPAGAHANGAVVGGSQAAAASAPVGPLCPPVPIQSVLAVSLGRQTSARDPSEQVPYELQADNRGRDGRGRAISEVVLLVEKRRVWQDTLPGHVQAMAGSSRAHAVFTASGDMYLYTPAGRRMSAPLRLGAAVFSACMAADSSLLMVVLADGGLKVWDIAASSCLLEASVSDLLRGEVGREPVEVVRASLSSTGVPIINLSDSCAYAYTAAMRAWVCVADETFLSSRYTTNMPAQDGGELGSLLLAAAANRTPSAVLPSGLALTHAQQERQAVAQLETHMAAAAAIGNAADWRRWAKTYTNKLAADGEEVKLRELFTDLLGPLRWSPSTHHPSAAATATTTTTASSAAGGLQQASTPHASLSSLEARSRAGGLGAWSPHMLGMSKRAVLQELLSSAARHGARSGRVQELVMQVNEQLREAERFTAQAEAITAQHAVQEDGIAAMQLGR